MSTIGQWLKDLAVLDGEWDLYHLGNVLASRYQSSDWTLHTTINPSHHRKLLRVSITGKHRVEFSRWLKEEKVKYFQSKATYLHYFRRKTLCWKVFQWAVVKWKHSDKQLFQECPLRLQRLHHRPLKINQWKFVKSWCLIRSSLPYVPCRRVDISWCSLVPIEDDWETRFDKSALWSDLQEER